MAPVNERTPDDRATDDRAASAGCVHLLVRGHVQGVFFRESARREAERLGVRGWVRNRPTGEVEAIAQGVAAQLEQFVQWCHRGPPAARVDAVEVSSVPASAESNAFTSFEVRR